MYQKNYLMAWPPTLQYLLYLSTYFRSLVWAAFIIQLTWKRHEIKSYFRIQFASHWPTLSFPQWFVLSIYITRAWLRRKSEGNTIAPVSVRTIKDIIYQEQQNKPVKAHSDNLHNNQYVQPEFYRIAVWGLTLRTFVVYRHRAHFVQLRRRLPY